MPGRKNRRIGIFGGTFDPPHIGHLAVADAAVRQLHLDALYLVPAYLPPHKLRHAFSSSPRDRERMTRLALHGIPRVKISTIELRRRGISYTVDTLRAFRKKFRSAVLFLIIGEDTLDQFSSWRKPEEILTLADIVVYRRTGCSPKSPKGKIEPIVLHGRRINVSSTEIRNRIASGKPAGSFLPGAVDAYIRKHRLYTTTMDMECEGLHDEIHRPR